MHMNGRRAKGFTLIELMIVVGVIAILAAIAIPNFLEQSKKGRRAEAMSAVGELQLRQERWRAENPAYATQTQLGTMPDVDSYTIAVTAPTNPTAVSARTQYTITATATGKQATDRCGNLTMSYDAGTGTPTWSGDADCND
jgi:type IV pilus assembly protein PilE